MARSSSAAIGSDRSNPILRSSTTNASRNARAISSGVPCTAAGSAIPQCAVIGCPGQNGHCSRAALSHTVNTKSSFGAPGPENSSQDLLRKPALDMPADSICLSASGRGCPEGWLPAL